LPEWQWVLAKPQEQELRSRHWLLRATLTRRWTELATPTEPMRLPPSAREQEKRQRPSLLIASIGGIRVCVAEGELRKVEAPNRSNVGKHIGARVVETAAKDWTATPVICRQHQTEVSVELLHQIG
jgi:hypothetical protein